MELTYLYEVVNELDQAVSVRQQDVPDAVLVTLQPGERQALPHWHRRKVCPSRPLGPASSFVRGIEDSFLGEHVTVAVRQQRHPAVRHALRTGPGHRHGLAAPPPPPPPSIFGPCRPKAVGVRQGLDSALRVGAGGVRTILFSKVSGHARPLLSNSHRDMH